MDLFVVPWTPFFFPGISMKRFFQEAHLSFGDHIDKLGNSVTGKFLADFATVMMT